MTVGELINELEKYDKDKLVILHDEGNTYDVAIGLYDNQSDSPVAIWSAQ